MSVATPTGTLTRKIHRQDASTSNPPSGGPTDAAPPTADQIPTATVRRPAGNAVSSSTSEAGMISAAPTARNATSIGTATATAHAAEARVKMATPTRKSRRRP